ncbi:hypothetical protein DE146DRAFT_619385 [Phaeosphaeria sp. MPI-PUGE-AT-0046c]|nr:hypothetical protein DE146DRAFT_619385 [Phaeosphaeria sp. MPI-PUGE-AT-0046c]
MPTYHARGVTISLGVSSLADTITSNIGLRKGDIVRKQCEQAEQALLNSRFLSEKRVPPSGDEHDFELHWLGGAPFMQAEVGRDSFSGHDEEDSPHPSSTVHSLRVHRPLAKHGIYETTCDPLALSLHVVTSERTFISGLDNSNKLHIKIEVFLNGTLSNCLFFPPYEYRSGAKELHQVFAGHRVDFLAERPWVILPPNTAADGSRSKATSLSSVEQRWAEICKALSKEADQRGSNKYSEVPSTAEFLKALAAMNMPPQVRTMQSPGGRQLGIVDVMITAGHGRKVTSGAAYLKAPQRFNDDNFPLRNTAEPPAGLNTAIHADGKRDGARNTPRPQQFPNSYTFDADRLSNLMMPSSAFPPSVVLESPRRSSIGSPPKAMSSPPTPPVSRREELYSQLPPLDQCAGSAPNMLSSSEVTAHRIHTPSNGVTFASPLDRLIKGRNGIIVVDYTWPITQHIPKHGQPLPLVKDAHQNCEPDAQLCPITIKNGGASNVMEGGSFGTHDTHGAGMTEHRMEHEPAQVAHSEIIPPEKESNKRNISKPVVPQRRTISGSNILGVQGPKATTFWFDNPEQLIREAAKERRIESSRKPRNDASIGPNTIALQASGVLTEPAARSSSPLSSIHTSPVAESDNRQMTEYIPSNLTADIPLSQLDGSSEPLLPTTLPSKPISPSKPNRKKRKAPAAPAVGRYLEKQPRSPDRLKTISNPPLNQDCVIALAESEDKSAERGVLRQVRGERQGVFAEDYVVFATRFFIPGN